MRITVEWETNTVTTHRAEVEVPAGVAAGGAMAVHDWIYDGNNDALIAVESEATEQAFEFTRETVNWQGVRGTYGPRQMVTVNLP